MRHDPATPDRGAMGRLLALVPIAVGISMAPLALGASLDVNASVQLTGSGTTYTVTLTNTGSDPIVCWQLTLAAGTQATGFQTPPAGWQVGGATAPPAQVIGGQNRTSGIPPGGSAGFTFTTNGPLGNGSQARISSTCTSGSDVTVPASGPGSTAPPPPPAARPCACKSLTARVSSVRFDRIGSLVVRLAWELECTDGTGGCRGTLTPTLGRAAKAEGFVGGFRNDSPKTVLCRGSCGEKRTSVVPPAFFIERPASVIGVDDAAIAARKARWRARVGVITIEVARTCGDKRRTPLLLDLAFDRKGFLDKAKSDLNGNGILDGREKRK